MCIWMQFLWSTVGINSGLDDRHFQFRRQVLVNFGQTKQGQHVAVAGRMARFSHSSLSSFLWAPCQAQKHVWMWHRSHSSLECERIALGSRLCMESHTACLCQPWTAAAAFCPASSTNPAWNPLHPALQGWASPGLSSCRGLVACKLDIHKHGWRHLGHPLWMICGAILSVRVCREYSNKVQGWFLRSRGGGLEMPALSLKGSGSHELWLTFIYAVASYPLWWNHEICGVLWKPGNYFVLEIHNCTILCSYLICLQF